MRYVNFNLRYSLLYFYLKFLFGMIGAKFTFLCDPVDYSNDPKALRVSTVMSCYLYNNYYCIYS